MFRIEVVHKFYCEIDLAITIKFTQNDVPIIWAGVGISAILV